MGGHSGGVSSPTMAIMEGTQKGVSSRTMVVLEGTLGVCLPRLWP